MTSPARKKRGLLRFAAFFLIPFLVIQAANAFLLRTDAHSYYTFEEMTQRDDIELALVGSSIVFANFNGDLITEKTGLETYSVTANHMGLPGALAATRLMYKTSSPEYVVLVVESDNIFNDSENIQTQMRLSPFLLKHPLISLRYYLDNVFLDQAFIDRILLFKSFFARSPEDVVHSFRLRFDSNYYAESGLTEGDMQDYGRGFLRYMGEGDVDRVLRTSGLRPDHTDKKKLLEYRDLCASHGSKLIVAISPNLTVHALRRNAYLQQNAILQDYCLEQDIPCFDFSMADHSFIPLLDSYYYDMFHLCGTGADLFSEKFAEFFNLYTAGEDVDHLFYSSAQEYLDTVDFITHVWADKRTDGGTEVFAADCMRGEKVTPEYQFSLLEEDGSLQILQDFSENPVFTCSQGALAGKTLRVHARPAGKSDVTNIYFDLSL